MSRLEHNTHKVVVIVFILVVAVAAGLRLYYIESRSLWFDEAMAVNLSKGSIQEVIENTRNWNSSPILFPTILWLVEKVSDRPLWVRFPAFAASLSAVVLVLVFLYKRYGPNPALVGGILIALSSSQIQYAQQVREYSLSVLMAVIIAYGLDQWARKSRGGHIILMVAVFFAPLIQYGLVILSVAAILVMITIFVASDEQHHLNEIACVGSALIIGSIISYFITLRIQWKLGGQVASHIQFAYYNAEATNIVKFIYKNSIDLMYFTFPGGFLIGIILYSLVIYASYLKFDRSLDPIILLATYALATTIVAAVFRFYPYSGIRQCIYLTPILIMSVGIIIADVIGRISSSRRMLLVLFTLIALLSADHLRQNHPYSEEEDIKLVLTHLDKYKTQDDLVYVYWAATPALKYYIDDIPLKLVFPFNFNKKEFSVGLIHDETKDAFRNYIMGRHYTKNDIKALFDNDLRPIIEKNPKKIWLIFSHSVYNFEDKIINYLPKNFIYKCVVKGSGAALYVIEFK